ncbi:MAG: cytochrome c biogenesis protein CcdA [Rhodobacteraceae bacterium]|nr:cytochrome c biogenesis protein CcdA [Paracoccaceae bacterium]
MFGIEIVDAALLPSLIVALLAGVISFLSPCVLPIVPPYLAYMGGVSMGDMQRPDRDIRTRATLAALFFVLGLSTVFLVLGFTASLLGQFFLVWKDRLLILAGLVIMVFGAHFIGVFRIGFLDRDVRMDAGDCGGSAVGAYVLGLAFAFGWTPCIGPILGAILALAAVEESTSRGIVLLGFYALGLGIPFLLVALFFPRLSRIMARINRHLDRIEKVIGVLLWTVGLLMMTGTFTDFALWLNEHFPILQQFG